VKQARGALAPVGNETPLQSTTAHRRRHACVQPGAAGVSQPWFGQRACKCLSSTLRTTFILPSHGGLTPAALDSDVRLCIAKSVFSSADVRTARQERGALAPRGFANALTSAFPAHYGQRSPDHNRAGLTYGTVVRPCGSCRAMLAFCGIAFELPSHGGLTPAALRRPFVGRGTMRDSRGTASVWRATVG
jgi:hypothetical protein